MSENTNNEFDGIINEMNDDVFKDEQIAALLERVDELTKRVNRYEQTAHLARHARRLLFKATERDQATAAAQVLREALRQIHPEATVE